MESKEARRNSFSQTSFDKCFLKVEVFRMEGLFWKQRNTNELF